MKSIITNYNLHVDSESIFDDLETLRNTSFMHDVSDALDTYKMRAHMSEGNEYFILQSDFDESQDDPSEQTYRVICFIPASDERIACCYFDHKNVTYGYALELICETMNIDRFN